MAAPAQSVPPPRPRRVSYVVPMPSHSPPHLTLPPLGVSRRGHIGPLYSQQQRYVNGNDSTEASSNGHRRKPKFLESDGAHPRHRLAVQALALDLSTAVSASSSSDPAPSGILYTGGRDGLVSSWELGLPTRRRRKRYGSPNERVGSGSDSSGSDDSDVEDTARRPWRLNALDIDLGELDKDVSGGAASKEPSRRTSRLDSASSDGTQRGVHPDHGLPIEEAWEVDDDRVHSSSLPPAKFRQCLQSHTDWVNDIVLCDYNRTLVSASSDSLLVAWNPHSMTHDEQVTPNHIGRHGDYVRCLASARDAKWVASGGFDRKIKLWDIQEGRSTPLLELASSPASIYSLGTTSSGNLIAAGTPERVIRIWDPRSRNQVARLGGHMDNVRAVLLSDDGKWVLSASSDATVKLWSVAGQKCLHTFAHHSSSVWSLFSQHPTFERFYSGDRNGNIAKIDFEGTADPGEGECIVLARDSAEENGDVRPGGEGITQIVAQDDSWVWTAGGSSTVKCWRDIAPRAKRAAQTTSRPRSSTNESSNDAPFRTETPPNPESPAESPFMDRDRPGHSNTHSVSFLESLTSNLSRTTSTPSPRPLPSALSSAFIPNRPSSLRTRPPGPSPVVRAPAGSDPARRNHSGQSTPGVPGAEASTLFNVPYDALVPLTSPEDDYFAPAWHRSHDPEISTLYSSASAVSVLHSYSANRFGSPVSHHHRPLSVAETTFEADNQEAMIARREYSERESVAEATPLRSSPDDIIEGRVGLIRCELLNDRRHALTIDSENEVLLWDIVEARCIGIIDQTDLLPPTRRPSDVHSTISGSGSLSSGSDISSHDVLDYAKERIEGEGSTASWCKCDTRVGALTIHLEDPRVFEAEVYVDEAYLGPTDEYPADHRFTMGKWVLRNLFRTFIDAEAQLRASDAPSSTSPATPSRHAEHPQFISLSDLGPPSLPNRSAKTPGMTIGLATPAASRALLPSVPQSNAKSPRKVPWELSTIASSPNTPREATTPFFNGPSTPTESKTPTPRMKSDDYFSLPPSEQTSAQAKTPGLSTSGLPAASPAAVPAQGGTLMGRLRNLGKGSKRPSAGELSGQPAQAAAEMPATNGVVRTVEEEQQYRILETVFAHPVTPCPPLDAPRLQYDHNMAILLSEETPDASAWAVTYRGLVGTGDADMSVLEQKSPLWLLDFLLGNRILFREPVKISFVVQPWQDAERAGLSELPNSNARLTANRSLRIRKVMGYVADKLELREMRGRAASIAGGSTSDLGESPPSSDGTQSQTDVVTFVPEDQIEILCGDVQLTPRMTLASVRAFYWKSGGDVVLSYRLRSSQPA